ncbi:copper resistance protein NlpE N-terminal domain-containing protein [Cyanobacterium aponinum UTEX 3221]|uniref:META domain-containing protein n=1 Tax=Cyanobacterium aponinum 0216 TaxID=2676140 RepID=A0A844GVF4_9CHRO|nr:copper resistance protein NlpE N-terminal domain-containing protein [Cyanobacterium aponinum]MTF39032.1 META domain-containing protein [Cyanobacterium aponinum 0216]PHV62203.1 hypothetical protein CSQ80_11500 [Cyanobacterium aponinum IPPAS B-1201]WRL38090.1 copper resistance protein NlpE N-terminal domain-containing protein [Cyanobacterium aponinum UTEX 3221]
MKYKLILIPTVLLSLLIPNYFLSNSLKAQNSEDIMESVTPAIGDTSQNSLDWNGVYEGILPCASCEGIKTTIILNQDLTFVQQVQYLGIDERTWETKGTFQWNEAGNRITLQGIEQAPNQFIVGENRLIQLDMNGDRISGDLADKYILNKVAQASMTEDSLTDVRWQLTEMMGKPVTKSENQREPIFLIFNSEENRVNGFAGCNNFMGGFELKEGNRLTLKQMASTMMACENMETEISFLRTLEQVDNYTIKDGVLSLNKAKMSPLLVFTMAQ